jgi:hypothetical protein
MQAHRTARLLVHRPPDHHTLACHATALPGLLPTGPTGPPAPQARWIAACWPAGMTVFHHTGPPGHTHQPTRPPPHWATAHQPAGPQVFQAPAPQANLLHRPARPQPTRLPPPACQDAACPLAHRHTSHCPQEEGSSTTTCWLQTCLGDASKQDWMLKE